MSTRIQWLVICFLLSICGATSVVEAQTVTQLTLAGSGLPPGPLTAFPTENPLPPGMVYTHRFNYGLAGLSQIPTNAEISEVRLVRISSSTFNAGAIQARMRPLIADGVSIRQ